MRRVRWDGEGGLRKRTKDKMIITCGIVPWMYDKVTERTNVIEGISWIRDTIIAKI